MIYLGMQGQRNRSQLEGGRPRWERLVPIHPQEVARWSPHRPESKSRPAAFLDHFLPRTRPSTTQPPLRTTWAPSPHNLPAFACHLWKLGTKKYYWLLFCSDVIVPPAEKSCSCWPERLPLSISAWVGGVIPLPHCRIELKCILPEKNLNTIKW